MGPGADDLEGERTGPVEPLRFGTAGLRGRLGDGPAAMNSDVVRAAAAAVARRVVRDAHRGPVVVAYDARPSSDTFAHDTAEVVAAHGVTVVLVDGVVPTPVLAWHVLVLGAAAGVMVTASHNPAGDSGYKVYWSDGAQIRPDLAADIERLMASELDGTAPAVGGDTAPITRRAAVDAIAAYVDDVIEPGAHGDPVPVVYSPLCGVAAPTLLAACERAGRPAPRLVPEESEPDGSFPGLPFPNPEEPAAWRRAERTAEAAGIDHIVVNDPDGDRLGVAVRAAGGWRRLTGSEIGALLVDHLLARRPGERRLVVSSNVSTRHVAAIARDAGATHVVTPTGFKWVIRPLIDDPDAVWVMGYEEALGFAVDRRVRDKDGITAAMTMFDVVDACAAEGGVAARLDRLVADHGLYASRQITWAVDPMEAAERIGGLVTDPPGELAGLPAVVVAPAGDEPLTITAGSRLRIAVRPSGTEPKLKAYLEAHEPAPVRDVADARARAERDLDVAERWLAARLGGRAV